MAEEFFSDVKEVPYNDERIFATLSDLNNLERVKDKLPKDKLKDLSFDQDSCSVAVDPIGKITFQIVEREPNRLIKFTTTNSPIPLHLRIQLEPVTTEETRMKLLVQADLNPFIKQMVAKPLQDALDKLATVLAGFTLLIRNGT